MSGDVAADESLLLDVAEAVTSIDERMAAVEAALVAPPPTGAPVGRVRRRRPPTDPQARALQRRWLERRGDAGGITWTVWELDRLDPDERVAALHELRRFVDWLNRSYELPLSTLAVAPCWYRHGGVVRELWALLASYQDAYTTTRSQEATRPTEAPILWHDRTLWACLRRLRDEHGLRECVTGRHTPQVNKAIETDDGFGGAVERLAAGGWNP